MKAVLAIDLLGRDLPTPGVAVLVVAAMVIFFLLNRASPGAAGGSGDDGGRRGQSRVEGHGRLHQCTRCGRNFHAEQIEHLPNGQQRHLVNDRCPNCGWDLDWGNADDPNNPKHSW